MSFFSFSLLISDLPGKPGSIFALAGRLNANASSIENAGDVIRFSDAAAPSWKGASFEAFSASKDEGVLDVLRHVEGLREAAGILERHAWAMEARHNQVADMKATLADFDRQVNASPDSRKLQTYLDPSKPAQEICNAYADLFDEAKKEANECAALLREILHIEPMNFVEGWGNVGEQRQLTKADYARINRELKNPSVEALGQQGIGDCYYIAVLGAVAHTQRGRDWLRSCVKAHYDESGRQDGYLVTIYDDPLHPDVSPRRTVFVNDVYAKGNVKGGKPSFVSLFEAAYGQEHPGGTRPSEGAGTPGITGGSTEEGLEDITGKGTRSIKQSGSFLSLFNGYPPGVRQIIAREVRDHPMVASTDPSLSGFDDGEGHAVVSIDGKRQSIKISPKHAYAVVGADKNGVTLYNPWGHNDPVNGGQPCGGRFKMSWEDFEKYYGKVAVGEVP